MSFILFKNQSSTPATPASGKSKIYFGSDKALKAMDDTGAITTLATRQVAIFNDTKSSGTNGGTFTQDADQTRTLNTTQYNGITGCSLASNQITLPAGTYKIIASAPAVRVSSHCAFLYNATDSSISIMGTAEYGETGSYYAQQRSYINGVITIAAQKVFEVRHRCTTSRSTDGYGVPHSFTSKDNVFTIIEIEKIG